MRALNYSFIQLIVIIICTSFIITPITYKNHTIYNHKVIVEGELSFIAPYGTREIAYPSGFALKKLKWISEPPTTNTTIFLFANNLEKFINKNVHVEGKYLKVQGKKYNNWTFSMPYDKIIVDTIYCIN